VTVVGGLILYFLTQDQGIEPSGCSERVMLFLFFELLIAAFFGVFLWLGMRHRAGGQGMEYTTILFVLCSVVNLAFAIVGYDYIL
jgi:hypothetical protein